MPITDKDIEDFYAKHMLGLHKEISDKIDYAQVEMPEEPAAARGWFGRRGKAKPAAKVKEPKAKDDEIKLRPDLRLPDMPDIDDLLPSKPSRPVKPGKNAKVEKNANAEKPVKADNKKGSTLEDLRRK